MIWPATERRVMTLEWVSGDNMGDIVALRARGTDLTRLSERIIQSFLLHALRDGFFHGDMHQGDLKLGPDGAIVALDFGIMGRIDAYTRKVYAEIMIGFLRKDYMRVAEVHFEAGYVPADQESMPSPRRCARWESRSSGRMRETSRWRNCSDISSR